MGKAAVDLPDPVETATGKLTAPAGSPEPNGADDLLAQLAGEEIDRLLAEADSAPAEEDEQSRASASAASPSAADEVTSTDEVKASVDAALERAALSAQALADEVGGAEAVEAALPPAQPIEAPPASGETQPGQHQDAEPTEVLQPAELNPTAPSEATVDAVLSSAIQDQRASGEAPAPVANPEAVSAARVVPTPPVAPAEPEPSTEPAASAQETVDQELAALISEPSDKVTIGSLGPAIRASETITTPQAPASGVAASAHSTTGTVTVPGGGPVVRAASDEGSLPLYVRLLELLNAPLSGLSPQTREFLGQVAIITLFNAFAVLLYVILFRPGK